MDNNSSSGNTSYQLSSSRKRLRDKFRKLFGDDCSKFYFSSSWLHICHSQYRCSCISISSISCCYKRASNAASNSASSC